MIVKAWLTGTQVQWSDDDSGDYAESHGWVDVGWSRTELFDSRNDVRPVAEWDSEDPDDVEDHPSTDDFIRATVAEYLGGADDNGNGTFYGVDAPLSDHSLRTGIVTTYALHFTHKRYDSARGWVEDSVTLSDGAVL